MLLPAVALDSDNVDACNELTDALIRYGAVVVRCNTISEAENDAFLDLLEDYFDQSEVALQEDTRPEYGYQVGATLESTERPKCRSDVDCRALIATLLESERPLDMMAEHADPKSRFFHRLGQPEPADSPFASLAMPNVTPAAFSKTWPSQMDTYGNKLLDAITIASEMLAIGLGLPRQTIVDAARHGSHLLAPTATDLRRHGKLDTIFAGFHADLGFLTIHGRSRYPGLNIWARNTGVRIAVSVPPGHLLIQSGMQLERLTGGLILAGFHEVACTEATIAAMERRAASHPDRPPIRISSTLFHHLAPLKNLRGSNPESDAAATLKYPAMPVGRFVEMELAGIALM